MFLPRLPMYMLILMHSFHGTNLHCQSMQNADGCVCVCVCLRGEKGEVGGERDDIRVWEALVSVIKVHGCQVSA